MMFLLAVVLVGAALYFVPTVIAAVRNGKHLGAVIVVNVLLGWTFIGWVVAQALAIGSSSRTSRPLYPYSPLPGPWSYPPPPPRSPPRPGDVSPRPAASIRAHNRQRLPRRAVHRDGYAGWEPMPGRGAGAVRYGPSGVDGPA